MTAMRSLMASASSWSWVTKTRVTPSRFCSSLSSELHLLAQLAIERAQRLVAEQHRRLDHQRAGKRHALLLAARKLTGLACFEARQRHLSQRRRDPSLDLRLRHLAHAQAEGHILRHRPVREQRIGLEHHSHVPPVHRQVGDVAAADMDAARVGVLEARDHAQARRLAAARRPQQREELAGGDVERDGIDGHDAAVERLGHLVQLDGGGGHVRTPPVSPSGSW